MRITAILAAALALAACSGDADDAAAPANGVLAEGLATDSSAVAADALPADLAALVQATIPGMQVAEAERKEREGRVYYDIEGTRPDGSEVELDVLQEGEAYRVVEIQRDLAWSEVPADARAAAEATADFFTPERVIESQQTEDGSTIYELFAPGRPGEPAMEVQVKDGAAKVLTERWGH